MINEESWLYAVWEMICIMSWFMSFKMQVFLIFGHFNSFVFRVVSQLIQLI